MNNFINWCINKHKQTNHFYDQYLPYEFHLRMVDNVYEQFKYLLEEEFQIKTLNSSSNKEYRIIIQQSIKYACWAHDLIEDCRVSYNDIVIEAGTQVAEIVYAVTNEKGKTRSERANDKYYERIRNTYGAVFVKLCDRIANVQYSKLTKSKMFEKYKNENDYFTKSLGEHGYGKMVEYLNNLFVD